MAIMRIVVKDDQAAPIEGATVSIYAYDPDELGSVTASGTTNSDGLVDLDVAAGDYAVCAKPASGAYSHSAMSKIVFSTAATYDVTLSSSAVGTPSLSGLCRVYVDLRQLDGTEVGGSTVYVLPSGLFLDENWLSSERNIWPKREGAYLYFDLPKGLSASMVGLTDNEISFNVPETTTANFLSLIVDAPHTAAPASTTASVAAEASTSVALTVSYYGGLTPTSGTVPHITVTSSDDDVATASLDQANSEIDITGVAAGTATVTITRNDNTTTVPGGFVLNDLNTSTITVTVT